MYKKYLLKCSVFSASNGWKDENITETLKGAKIMLECLKNM